MTKGTCAGIMLYNPDIERLTQNINAVLQQVDMIIFIDNASTNTDELRKTFVDGRFAWINNSENRGVSGALNQLVEFAAKNDFEWILTLDQDSICGANLVNELYGFIQNFDNVAMVSPRIVDRNLERIGVTYDIPSSQVEEISMCITSGCLTSVKAILNLGGFNERLFIDQVDHDMCLRLKRSGYRILRANTVELLQEYGQDTVRRKLLWKTIIYHIYPPMRIYYQTRNQLFMVRKYSHEFTEHPFKYALYLFIRFGVTFIYEPNRLKRLSAFIRGYVAGLLMKL